MNPYQPPADNKKETSLAKNVQFGVRDVLGLVACLMLVVSLDYLFGKSAALACAAFLIAIGYGPKIFQAGGR